MKRIDEPRLESDLAYRFGYLTEFMGFTTEDVAAIHASAQYLAPAVSGLVDAVYDKLFSYDATKRHFTRKQSGYDGPVPDGIDSISQEHEMIAFRKQHLARYLTALVTRPYDNGMLCYLDMVGKIHTPKAGSKDLNVPLVQMNALLGFVSDALLATIQGLALESGAKTQVLRAFNKLLWLQNDLITRHYATPMALPGRQNEVERIPTAA
jgi:hypothetical protein